MSQISISELSQTISELIDLDADQQSLLGSAIDRAIDARNIVGGTALSGGQSLAAGGIMYVPPCNTPTTAPCNPNPHSFPIGKIAGPIRGPIVIGQTVGPIHLPNFAGIGTSASVST
jgi:hypothetical protein